MALPKSIADARLTSVTRWSVCGEWGGVRLGDLLADAGIKPEATHVQFLSYRKIYSTCIPLDVALQERTLLAYEFDGEPLDADYGGPVRAFCPYLWGYKSAKSVVAVTLEDRSIPGYWEVEAIPTRRRSWPGACTTSIRIGGGTYPAAKWSNSWIDDLHYHLEQGIVREAGRGNDEQETVSCRYDAQLARCQVVDS